MPVAVKKAVVMRPSPGSMFSSAVLPALRDRMRRRTPYKHIMSPGRAGSQKIQERIQRRVSDPKIISESMEDPYQGSLELAEFLASRGLFDDRGIDDRLYLQSYLSRPGETYAASSKDLAGAMPEWRRNQLFTRPRDLGVVFRVMGNPHVESGRGIMPITVTPVNPHKPVQPTYAYTGAPIGSSTIPSKVQTALMENYEDLIQPPSSIYDVRTGEVMDDAWSTLLKEEPTVHPGEERYIRRQPINMPNRDDVHPEWYNWIQELIDEPWEYEGLADDFMQPDMDHLAGATSREDFFKRLYDLHNFAVGDPNPPFDYVEGEYRDFTDVPFNDKTSFTMSEPMDIAFQLLKERKSPEAMRHKLEYDKQYEKTPERRKYQRELHAERRKRGIYGTGDHMDVSHTQGGRLTLEPEHANRARHFKDRGTLRVV